MCCFCSSLWLYWASHVCVVLFILGSCDSSWGLTRFWVVVGCSFSCLCWVSYVGTVASCISSVCLVRFRNALSWSLMRFLFSWGCGGVLAWSFGCSTGACSCSMLILLRCCICLCVDLILFLKYNIISFLRVLEGYIVGVLFFCSFIMLLYSMVSFWYVCIVLFSFPKFVGLEIFPAHVILLLALYDSPFGPGFFSIHPYTVRACLFASDLSFSVAFIIIVSWVRLVFFCCFPLCVYCLSCTPFEQSVVWSAC